DHDGASLQLDAREPIDAVEIDQVPRARQALLHRRDQGLTAGEKFRVFELFQHVARLTQPGRTMVGEIVHQCSPEYRVYSAALRALLPFWVAFQTGAAVAGMAPSSLPIASVIALMTAAGAAIAPASPQPLMPSGFDGHLVSVMSTANVGKLKARGMV